MDLHECRLCFKRGDNHIELFDGSEHSVFIVSVVNEHIGETRHDDLLPNYICHECWRETDAFHTFHRSVQSAQSNYLLKFVKNEFNESAVSIEEVNVDEMNVEEDMQVPSFIEDAEVEDKFPKQETELHDDMFDDTVADSIEEDDDNETTESQSKDANFDFTCDVCGIDQGSLNGLISHYKKQHEKIGYIKCCSNKYFSKVKFNEHIEYHKNPDVYKCQECGTQLKTRSAYYTHKFRHKKKFTCDICNYITTDKCIIKSHMKRKHTKKVKISKTCPSCLIRFSNLDELEAHKEQCSGEDCVKVAKEQRIALKKFIVSLNTDEIEQNFNKYFDMSCDLCSDGTNFNSLAQIKYHYLNEHQINDGYIKCCESMKLKTQDQILDHVPYHILSKRENLKCKACGVQKISVSRLVTHLRRHIKAGYFEFECSQCDKKFAKKSLLLCHIYRIHEKGLSKKKASLPNITDDNRPDLTEYFDMNCSHSKCKSVKFTSFHHAKEHYLQEHNDPNGFIQCCGINFNTIEKVDEHLVFHTHPEQFTCNCCGSVCMSKQQYRSHMSKHVIIESGAHKCNICTKSFICDFNLQRHLKSHKEKTAQMSQFQCSFCNRKFQTEDMKKSHEKRIHLEKLKEDEKREICEFCAKRFPSKYALIAHTSRVHSSDQPEYHQCDICNAVLKSKSSLMTHRSKHTAQPQKCPHCQKVSINANALEFHIKRIHKLKPIHQCNQCEKSFKDSFTLKCHIATHTGEKNFKCSFCPESFIWRPNMYAHRKKMHPTEWAESKKQKTLTL